MTNTTKILIIDDQWGSSGNKLPLAKFEKVKALIGNDIEMNYSQALGEADEYSVEAALKSIKAITNLSAIILDIVFGKEKLFGIEILKAIKKDYPFIPVLMFTSLSSEEDIKPLKDAFRWGASDYIEKSWAAVVCSKILAEHLTPKSTNRPTIWGNNELVREMRSKIITAAYSNANVIVTGEFGTGKELVARSIHNFGPRRNGPFISENVGYKDTSIIESELFGHVKGAFTGANETKIGLMEAANGGTLFLDEFATIPMSLQVRLLRALETRTITRLGEVQTRKVEFQLICATNIPLEKLIANGSFREDLYFRVDELRIDVPSLTARKDDIPLLCDYFLKNLYEESPIPLMQRKQISPKGLAALEKYNWPGNIRQLRNVIHKAYLFSDKQNITAEEIEQFLQVKTDVNNSNKLDVPAPANWPLIRKKLFLSFIVNARKKCSNNAEFISLMFPEARNDDFKRVINYMLKAPYGAKYNGEDDELFRLEQELLSFT